MSIETMKRALQEHRKNERHRTLAETRYWCEQYKLLAQQAIKALAQPKQQPVGYIDHADGRVVWFSKPALGALLYTTPPKRKPLTDGALDLILQRSPIQAKYGDLVALSRDIEDAHDIKGGA